MVCSPKHNEIKEKLYEIADSVHDIDGFVQSLNSTELMERSTSIRFNENRTSYTLYI